jgi:hypothetical protein
MWVSYKDQHSVFLSFTTNQRSERPDPLRYEVRYALTPMSSWSSATTVSQGTCVDYTSNWLYLACSIEGLEAGKTYDFQLVTYRGTLDQDAEFGGLSNVTGATLPQ